MSENNKRKRDNNDDNNTSKTVKLNVGGRKHEVSRDLVMDNNKCTMLSRLVSETWLEDPEKEVFIDRNGDTFSYVLDYLRHGEIMLPRTVTKDTFLKELDFFSIDTVPGSVRIDNVCSAMSREYEDLERDLEEKKKLYEKAQKDLREAEVALNYEKKHLNKATEMFGYYHKHTKSKSRQCDYFNFYESQGYKRALLNKYLGKVGLKYDVENGSIQLLE
eukprot:CAMPEP_0178953730 /NCGR_PEP_ID=MMETSP0789-20121207/8583_1 /TAXON_ID=3005 /ORGANISM="Rhizosolenia setigera, Strain CCMP 1694" /LENGTH=217 /DNA_ID=CAMNT_0020635025 /DNA_START=44 /DNA_END=697 /DNA_ORIENTATION=-